MKQNTLTQGDALLKEFLLLNAYSCIAPGVAQGKAGMSLALFAMARKNQDEFLEDRAFDILQQALVYSGKNIHFSIGSAGIGFVLLYLIREHYVEADFEELFGEQYQHILQTVCSDEMEYRQQQDCAELLLYLNRVSDYVSGKDLQRAEEILADRMQEYYRKLCGKTIGGFSPEEFYGCSSLLLTLYQEGEPDDRWWKEIRICYEKWQERLMMRGSLGLGYKLMKFGKVQQSSEARDLGGQLFCQALKDRFPGIMSLREQTNLLYFLSQEEECAGMRDAEQLKNAICDSLVYAEREKLEKQIVDSARHYAFYCGFEGGVSRLLLLRTYWEQMKEGERLPQLEYLFY